MFGFFKKKKPAPETCPSNPGVGIEAKVAFANGERSWTEKVNLVNLAAAVFKKHGVRVSNGGTWLHHADSGFMFLPQLAARGRL